MLLNGCGIAGSVCASILMMKFNLLTGTKSYILLNLLVFICLILSLILPDTDTTWPCYLMNGMLGFVNIPIFFISYELAVEQTIILGVGEATSCGIINLLANFISFVEILGLTFILND